MHPISKSVMKKDLGTAAQEFLELASEQRLEILARLYENNSKVSTIAKELEATVPEVYRNFERLVKANLISKEPAGDYTITTYGKIVYNQIPTLQFLVTNKKYFHDHGFGDLPSKFLQRIGALTEGRYLKGFVKVMEQWKGIYSNAQKYISNILVEVPYTSDMVEPLVKRLGSGVILRSILSDTAIVPQERKQVLDKLGFKKLIEQGKIERKMKKDVSIVLIMNEKEACIMFPKKSGEADLSEGFYSTDSDFNEWCSDYFSYCWEHSHSFEESKLKNS